MLTEGQLVMHETAGVCRVVGETKLDGLPGQYYVLCPLYVNDATFYTPKESQKVKIRPVMSQEEAHELIAQLPDVPSLTFENQNDQKLRCAAILKSGDSYQLASLAKTLYLDQLRRSRQNKRSGISDATMLKKTEQLLFGELATALGLEYQDVLEYIQAHLK